MTVLADGRELETTSDNLSLGGMFLLTSEKLEYGKEVTIRFRLPALKEDTVTNAVIRWTRPEGFGVQFGSLRALEVWALNQYFKTLVRIEMD